MKIQYVVNVYLRIFGIGNNIGSLYKHVSIQIDDTSVSEYLLGGFILESSKITLDLR